MFDRAKFEMATHLGRVVLYLRTKDGIDCPLSRVWNDLSDDEKFGIVAMKQQLEIPLKEWEQDFCRRNS